MTHRMALIIDETFITVPVTRPVEMAITEWIVDHLPALEAKLAPLGLLPEDLALPEWHRLVYQDEALSCDVEHEGTNQPDRSGA